MFKTYFGSFVKYLRSANNWIKSDQIVKFSRKENKIKCAKIVVTSAMTKAKNSLAS